MQEFMKRKSVISGLIAVAAVFALLAIFEAGIFVGIHKAQFSERMGGNYYSRAFGPSAGGMRGFLENEELPNAFGAAGKVLSVSLPTFIVDDRGVEKVILITDDTQIRRLHDIASTSDIKPDDVAVIIGSPDDKAEIRAKLIRILPPPPEDTDTSQ